ncbi:MAG: hypothetical protein ABNH21_07450 [Glaciecola sp.]
MSNSTKWILSITVVFALASVIAVMHFSEDETLVDELSIVAKENASPSTPPTAVPLDPSPLSKSTANSVTETMPPEDAAIFKAQITQVADMYSETAQYPIGSQPIRNPAEAYEPKAFEEANFTVPYPMQNGGTLEVNAALNKHQYFAGEDIQIRLQIKGSDSDAFIEPSAVVASSEKDLLSGITFVESATSTREFLATVRSDDISDDLPSPELLLKVTIDVDGETFFITQGFTLFQASAAVTGIGRSEVDDANLLIPVKIDVEEAGYYFLNAILEDEESAKPLVALQTEGRLKKGNKELRLLAHIQALKVGESEGPYTLRSIKLYRGAKEGEQFDVPGKSNKKSFPVQGFSFEQYSDVKHVDPLAKEREAFLRSLAK